MPPSPIALSPAMPSELLSYILTHQSYPTTLVICQPRATFLTTLLRYVPRILPKRHAPAPPPSHHYGCDVEGDLNLENVSEDQQTEGIKGRESKEARESSKEEPLRHHLLIPTLHQISTSRNINIVYTPTISHLRAYLSIFHNASAQDLPTSNSSSKTQVFTKAGTKVPLLVIDGLIECHRHTSEWSAQGLGMTLSALVEAGHRTERKVVLIEELDWAFECDEKGVKRKEYARRVWEERVPILNGSVRREGMESEEGVWSGRTVEIGRVLSRWFSFERGDWDD